MISAKSMRNVNTVMAWKQTTGIDGPRDREQRDQQREPMAHMSGRTHAAQDAVPARVHVEVARQRKIDQRARQEEPARRDSERAEDPKRHDRVSTGGRIQRSRDGVDSM